MKFSEQWLREWVNPQIDTAALAEQLSMAGLEVDGVEPVALDFTGVVVGEVVECGQHPDADKLRVTKVNVGDDELLDIVCGASNCRQGLKVAVATVGAVLPGDFKIKKAKLRGQPSHGMLCSASEIGLAEESEGILELPVDAPIGTDIRDYLQLNDACIEVDLTPNRADCLGIRGIAREVGLLNQVSVCTPTIEPLTPTIAEQRNIELKAPDACPRYLGRVLRGVDLSQPSPIWLQEKLRRSGVRSIDAVVDVTNYVLLELGHPMHAFDLQALDGDIQVRMAKPEEKLVLLDGNEVTLSPDTLVIADQQKALAMAGVFGGLHSGVTADSSDIFLESAFFSPRAIRGRARQYGLHTDAAHRYERGVDPHLQRTAMERATALLLAIVGGQAGPIVEAVSEAHLPLPKEVSVRASRIQKLLGIAIPNDRITDILTRLGLENVAFNEGAWTARVPSYRFDIAIEADLIEEIARVYGYNNIPEVAPTAALRMTPRQETALSLDALKAHLVSRGFQEAITYSFVDPKLQGSLHPHEEGLVLPYPISADMSVMRLSLMPGLLQAAAYNQKRQQQRLRLFEAGLRFVPDTQAENGVRQEPLVGGLMLGNVADEQWGQDNRALDFFDAKGEVEALLATVVADTSAFRFVADRHPALHPGQTAAIYRGEQRVGVVGALHPQHAKSNKLGGNLFLFELALGGIGERLLAQAQPISKFPSNRRDIAIVVEEQLAVGEILAFIENFGENQLVGLNLFDVYQGQGIAPGKKSLAISLQLQAVERTLEEQEIQAAVDAIVAGLAAQFGATLRD